jgi:hypothetical protein
VEEEAQFARGFNPPERHRLWRDVILPRSIIPLYWVYKVALFPFFLTGKSPRTFTKVSIKSGIVGWTHVYFEELYGSAADFFGVNAVTKQVIDRDSDYLPQFKSNQHRDKPDLVILDVRTPTQTWVGALIETYRMSALLLRNGATPMVVLTDAYYRRHRWQAAVITAYRGSVVTFSAKEIVRKIFPHDRIAGPLFMPISVSRLSWLENQKKVRTSERDPNSPLQVSFIGSMYWPREEFFSVVQSCLSEYGIELDINGDKAGTSNDQYWSTLVSADIILTTTLQGPERKFLDWVWVRQAVFRYSETMAAGTALVAGTVDGGFPYFESGQDFVEFESVEQCVESILQLVKNHDLRDRIAQHGHTTLSEYVKTGRFWRDVLGAKPH